MKETIIPGLVALFMFTGAACGGTSSVDFQSDAGPAPAGSVAPDGSAQSTADAGTSGVPASSPMGSGGTNAADAGVNTVDGGRTSGSYPNGSYLETCTGCDATTDQLSCASCRDGEGNSQASSLPLPCTQDITNCFGALTCGPCACTDRSCPSGSYLQSCHGCFATSTLLACSACKNGHGGEDGTSVALPCNAGLNNCLGTLKCGGC